MNATTVVADLAKDVIEVAESNAHGCIVGRRRLGRTAFEQFLAQHAPCEVVMEACGGAHHWGRKAQGCGHRVRLLPAQYVRAYRRRNKTDRADCAAILQASRDPEIMPVPVKVVESQAAQGLHRVRSAWMATRTARINTARGLLREFGLVVSRGATSALREIPELIEKVPVTLQATLQDLVAEIRELATRVQSIDRQLAQISREQPAMERIQEISGIGLLTGTALVASAGDPKHFRSGRHFAAWLGLTPREHSSGMTRHLGKVSKRGDVYVRTLLTHGARAVLARAKQIQRTRPDKLNYLQRWALQVEERRGHNKATSALANKLARIAWATWRYGSAFDPNHAAQAA
jgi:transposase